MLHLLDAGTLGALAGLTLAIAVLWAVGAALLAKRPDRQQHTLEVLAVLMRWRRQLPDEKPPDTPSRVDERTLAPRMRVPRFFTTFDSGTGTKNHRQIEQVAADEFLHDLDRCTPQHACALV